MTSVSPLSQDITPEEVRACPAFANLTDEEVQEVIACIKRFTEIIFHQQHPD